MTLGRLFKNGLVMDLGSITAAFSSLRVAGDIAKGLINLHETVEIQAKAIELNLPPRLMASRRATSTSAR